MQIGNVIINGQDLVISNSVDLYASFSATMLHIEVNCLSEIQPRVRLFVAPDSLYIYVRV